MNTKILPKRLSLYLILRVFTPSKTSLPIRSQGAEIFSRPWEDRVGDLLIPGHSFGVAETNESLREQHSKKPPPKRGRCVGTAICLYDAAAMCRMTLASRSYLRRPTQAITPSPTAIMA